jgi:uncharacterized OB-fold protein
MTSEVKPYFKSVKLQGMFISIELTKHPKASIDNFLKAVKERMGDLIVFVKCPKCGREVPKIDMTIHGYCYICFHQQQASEQNRKSLI